MQPNRQSFILRVWRDSQGREEWSATLVHIPTGETANFRSLSEFYSGLCTRLVPPSSGHELPRDQLRP